jgi:hypothetical protein
LNLIIAEVAMPQKPKSLNIIYERIPDSDSGNGSGVNDSPPTQFFSKNIRKTITST